MYDDYKPYPKCNEFSVQNIEVIYDKSNNGTL